MNENELESATFLQVRQSLRSEMPVARRWAYFDHAAVSPLSAPAAAAISRYAAQAAEQGDTVWPEWSRGAEVARVKAAELIGADKNEITLVTSTTMGINYVAEGIAWREGDNVVILADEFPSNAYPWMHQRSRGVETRLVQTDRGRLDLDRLRNACDGRTRVVSVSWVGYSTGYRQDIDAIADIAHGHGALLFLDAIQGMGVFPIDVSRTPVDFLAADSHKWMLGPEGAGFAYIRREALDSLRPIGVGWSSVVNCFDYSKLDLTLKPAASRYEGGALNMAGLLGFAESLKLLTSFPTESLAASILDITDYACERLSAAGARIVSHRAVGPDGHDPRSGIVAFDWPDRDPNAVRNHCAEAGVVLSCRLERLRISAHAYNTREDVDRLIDALQTA